MSKISDERRGAAERLREAAIDDGHVGRPYGEQGFQVTLRRIIGTSNPMRKTLYARLADLIDPTCEIATDQVDDGEWGAHDIYECCSECGNQNMRDRFTGKPYRFCPHCGARVTDGGDSR